MWSLFLIERNKGIRSSHERQQSKWMNAIPNKQETWDGMNIQGLAK